MSNLNPNVERVTQRIIERSKAGRARYLDLMAREGAYYRLYEAQAKNAEDAVARASTKESV